MERVFSDPHLELAHRLGGDPTDVIGLASDTDDSDAEIALAVLDEVEAEEQAASIVSRLRRMGHTL